MPDDRELTYEERARFDVEWMTTNALREGMVIAHKVPEQVTYKQAFALGVKVAPAIFSPAHRIIDNPPESAAAQEFRQQAAAQSLVEGETIAPHDYVGREIHKTKQQIEAAPDAHLLQAKLERLEAVRQELIPREYTETALIFQDAGDTGKELPYAGEGKGYKDFFLDKERMLRVRVTHMERPEDKIGADLIYESLNHKEKTVRIVMIQYKMWERYQKVIHYDPREQRQYEKLREACCQNGLCQETKEDSRPTFRLPHCTAFLRPTDRLQTPNALTRSSSLHIPICVVEQSWEENPRGGRSIRERNILDRSLSHRVFGELFNSHMVGSRELTWEEVTVLYRKFGIFDATDRVLVHLQESPIN